MENIYVLQAGFRYESGGETYIFGSLADAEAKFNEVVAAAGKINAVCFDWIVIRGPVRSGTSVENAPLEADADFAD